MFLALLTCLALASESAAQSSPADLVDLSLSELLDLEVQLRDRREDPVLEFLSHFSPSYHYVRLTFDGYRNNRKRVSNSALLGPPNGTTYPILQEKIVQEAHSFQLTFHAHERVSFSVMVPWIKQETDHISLVPGFDEFTISSEGVGDVTLTTSVLLLRKDAHAVMLSTGLSFPSGGIREKGHTPAGPGSQLPFTMQLGSGTWDIPIGMGYLGSSQPLPGVGSLSWGVSALGKVRTGRNSRGYRLGDRLLFSSWLRAEPLPWLHPVLKLEAVLWERIRGTDSSFPGPIFPTPVTDPRNFGGERIDVLVGARLKPPDLGDSLLARILEGQAVEFEFGWPVYQSLNGPQPEEDWRVSVGWTQTF